MVGGRQRWIVCLERNGKDVNFRKRGTEGMSKCESPEWVSVAEWLVVLPPLLQLTAAQGGSLHGQAACLIFSLRMQN